MADPSKSEVKMTTVIVSTDEVAGSLVSFLYFGLSLM